MKTNLALQTLRQSLHLSSSQINQYLLCSKKYEYHYVKGMRPSHTSINLLFGTAIHAALEAYYKHYQAQRAPLPLAELQQHFLDHLATDLAADNVLNQGGSQFIVKYTKELPDLLCVEEMGMAMLEAFDKEVDLTGYTIEGVELPLSAPLYDADGCETGFDLVGVIDLLLKDDVTGQLLAIDHKTSRNSYSDAMCDDSHQMSLYAYLLRENGFLDDQVIFHGRFDVLRKLKAPKFEQAGLTRTPDQIKQFLDLARGVLQAIDRQVYLPVYSWACSDCGYEGVKNFV